MTLANYVPAGTPVYFRHPLAGNGWSLSLVTPPTTEPVTLAQVKADRRLGDGTTEDTYLSDLITAARFAAENDTGRQLMPATWDLALDRFPLREFRMPKPPLQSVTSIKYVDQAGATQTMTASDYQVDIASTPGRITPAFGKYWPTARWQLAAVTIRFVAGYANAGDVDPMIRRAILLMVGDWYENRESFVTTSANPVPMAAAALLGRKRVGAILQ